MDRWKSTSRKQLRHGESQKGESQKGEDKRRRRSGKETARRAKMQVREKVGKSRNRVFLHCFVWLRGSKSRLSKVAGAEPAGQIKDEKLPAIVARSTFGGKKCQNTSSPEHF